LVLGGIGVVAVLQHAQWKGGGSRSDISEAELAQKIKAGL